MADIRGYKDLLDVYTASKAYEEKGLSTIRELLHRFHDAAGWDGDFSSLPIDELRPHEHFVDSNRMIVASARGSCRVRMSLPLGSDKLELAIQVTATSNDQTDEWRVEIVSATETEGLHADWELQRNIKLTDEEAIGELFDDMLQLLRDQLSRYRYLPGDPIGTGEED